MPNMAREPVMCGSLPAARAAFVSSRLVRASCGIVSSEAGARPIGADRRGGEADVGRASESAAVAVAGVCAVGREVMGRSLKCLG
eukprot:scaffold248400_cov27-Tisochrysis_lutea.AAC.1